MFSLSQFVDACRSALEDSDPPIAVRHLISEAVGDPVAVEASLGRERRRQNEPSSYLFLYQSASLTILNAVIPPRLQSPPHNHLTWAVIGLYSGREDNIFYRRDGDRIIERGRQDLAPRDVMVLDTDTIHSISNPLPHRSYALHVYGGALDNPARSLWNPFTLEEEPFHLLTLLKYEREMMERTAGKGG